METDEKLKIEFRKFGPWILEIKTKDDIPNLFFEHFELDDKVLLCFKIPKEIERRKAKAGMNLYNMVIVAYENYILILSKLRETEVEKNIIYYQDIELLQDKRDLLLGNLFLYTKEKVYKIFYNTVSRDITNKFIKMIRERYNTSKVLPTKNEYQGKITIGEFENFYIAHQKDENFYVLDFCGDRPAKKIKETIIDKIFNVYSRLMLQGTLFLSNSKEIVILSKKSQIKRKVESDYSCIYTYIPFSNINEFNCKKGDKILDTNKIIIKTNSNQIDFIVDKNINILMLK